MLSVTRWKHIPQLLSPVYVKVITGLLLVRVKSDLNVVTEENGVSILAAASVSIDFWHLYLETFILQTDTYTLHILYIYYTVKFIYYPKKYKIE